MRVVLLAGLFAFPLAAQEREETLDQDLFYVEAVATMTLPQGGARLPRRAGGALRFGAYVAEFWSLEAEAAWLEDRTGLSAKALWHWWGYERLDPFFTFGAKGWLPEGQLGPVAGAGTYWHLTERASLRFDADATLGLEAETETIYSLAVGFLYAF
jgi:hypothetical protein